MFRFLLSFLLIVSTTIPSFSKPEIQRIEPPNWWTDMEWNEIEVMLYGTDLAYLVPSIKYEGIQLKSFKSYENPNYLFVTLSITEEAQPGNLAIQLSDAHSIQLSIDFPILERIPGRKEIKGFDGSDVMYLITPDRFANGNPDNDSVTELYEKVNRSDKGGRHGGDIAGIVANLDYIKNMGFTSIWLNPLLENNMKSYSYHGYSTTDFYKVDERFGSNEDYKKFCDLAAEKGMKVIMDMIVNHCGSEHWWMFDLPSSDWINQWETYTGTNHSKTTLQDPHVAESDKKRFTDGWFVPTMPDLNQRNESMAKYLIQNSIWWIEYSGIAGIRMDTYPYPDEDFMSDWTEAVMNEYPNFNIVGEEWNEWPQIVSYWQAGKENKNGYTSALKSLMDFPLQAAMVKSLNEENNWRSTWNFIYEMLAQDYLYPDPDNLVIFPDNHDMSRIHTLLNKNVAHTKLALIFVCTTRGIPQIYYGTEILMANDDPSHGTIRSDFPGGWEGDQINAFTGEGLSDESSKFQTWLKDLLNWRKDNKTVHTGDLVHFFPENDVYVYFRFTKNDTIMIILNKKNERLKLEMERFKEYIPSNKAMEVLSKKEFNIEDHLWIDAKQGMVIEFK